MGVSSRPALELAFLKLSVLLLAKSLAWCRSLSRISPSLDSMQTSFPDSTGAGMELEIIVIHLPRRVQKHQRRGPPRRRAPRLKPLRVERAKKSKTPKSGKGKKS